jgi:hypothetical protein
MSEERIQQLEETIQKLRNRSVISIIGERIQESNAWRLAKSPEFWFGVLDKAYHISMKIRHIMKFVDLVYFACTPLGAACVLCDIWLMKQKQNRGRNNRGRRF